MFRPDSYRERSATMLSIAQHWVNNEQVCPANKKLQLLPISFKE